MKAFLQGYCLEKTLRHHFILIQDIWTTHNKFLSQLLFTYSNPQKFYAQGFKKAPPKYVNLDRQNSKGAQNADCDKTVQGSDLKAAASYLNPLQVTLPLCTLISLSVKWDNISLILLRGIHVLNHVKCLEKCLPYTKHYIKCYLLLLLALMGKSWMLIIYFLLIHWITWQAV